MSIRIAWRFQIVRSSNLAVVLLTVSFLVLYDPGLRLKVLYLSCTADLSF
jgi:hypothetical protein